MTEANIEPERRPSVKLRAKCIFSNRFLSVHAFEIPARAWKTISPTNHFADVSIPSLDADIHSSGITIVYLEGYNMHVVLPFIYYQMRKAVSVQASSEPGRIYIQLKGNFIININTSFRFKVLLVRKKVPKKFQDFNWQSFNEIRKKFRLRT